VRNIILSVFVLSLVVVLSGTMAFAQGRGAGHVPGDVSGPRTSVGNGAANDHTDHGKGADHQGGDHDADHKGAANFESRIENNPKLMARLQSLLPPNTDLKTAAMGFKNEGQFIAALHVSKNLNIPFDQLKAKMTGNPPESLGKAIQDLKPNMSTKDVKEAAETAEKQAKETEHPKSTTTTTSTTTTPTKS